MARIKERLTNETVYNGRRQSVGGWTATHRDGAAVVQAIIEKLAAYEDIEPSVEKLIARLNSQDAGGINESAEEREKRISGELLDRVFGR